MSNCGCIEIKETDCNKYNQGDDCGCGGGCVPCDDCVNTGCNSGCGCSDVEQKPLYDCYDSRFKARCIMVCAWKAYKDTGNIEDRKIFQELSTKLSNEDYCPSVFELNELDKRYA
jgi:hypothetical protein